MPAIDATKDCPLFRLDKKLRFKIYRYALTYNEPVPIRKHGSTGTQTTQSGDQPLRHEWRFTPGLLSTCTEIAREASPIFYAENTFTATLRNSDVSAILDWVASTSHVYLEKVKDFTLIIEPTSFADLLDMATASDGKQICLGARNIATALSKTSISSPNIALPELVHLGRDAELLSFEVGEAEQMRARWILELGSAFKKLGEENCLVRKLRGLREYRRHLGLRMHGKSLSEP